MCSGYYIGTIDRAGFDPTPSGVTDGHHMLCKTRWSRLQVNALLCWHLPSMQ